MNLDSAIDRWTICLTSLSRCESGAMDAWGLLVLGAGAATLALSARAVTSALITLRGRAWLPTVSRWLSHRVRSMAA